MRCQFYIKQMVNNCIRSLPNLIFWVESLREAPRITKTRTRNVKLIIGLSTLFTVRPFIWRWTVRPFALFIELRVFSLRRGLRQFKCCSLKAIFFPIHYASTFVVHTISIGKSVDSPEQMFNDIEKTRVIFERCLIFSYYFEKN